MITVNNVEMRTEPCDKFKYPVTIDDKELFSSEVFIISGDVEIINHETRTGTIFKSETKEPVRHLKAVKFVSDNVLPLNVNDPVHEKLTEIAEYLTCFILNPEAFDGRYVLIGLDGEDKPGSSYFTVSGVRLAAFYITTDFKPSPLKDEHVKMLIDQLPNLDIIDSLTVSENK